VATLVCVVVGALLHPAGASAAPHPSRPAVAVPQGLTVPVTRAQAAAWHLPDSTVTTRTAGGSTVVFTPVSRFGQPPQDFRYKLRWYGYYTVFFNRLETLRIAAGSAACAAVIKHIPRVGSLLSTLCALISVQATYARARNQCVMIQGWGLLYPQILRYTGNYCR
jgi:hypothetical protein